MGICIIPTYDNCYIKVLQPLSDVMTASLAQLYCVCLDDPEEDWEVMPLRLGLGLAWDTSA